jgi:transposase
MVKLDEATRNELLAVIAAQERQIAALQATNARLEGRIADLERRLGSGGPRGMPGTKPTQAERAAKTERKRRPHGFARARMEPTAVVEHAVEQCPTCGIRLLGGSVKRRREVVEVQPAPVQVIEHRYVERRCPGCGRRWVPKVALDGAVVDHQRLGVGLVSLIATLREVGRLPIRTIQWYLATVHQLPLSVGAITGALARVAAAGTESVAGIGAQIRASPVVHADETGWRQNGRNRYVWTFSTPTARYFICGGRDKGMVDTALGEDFAGVLVTDFYAAYNHYAGLHQRCWAHLLREIHDLKLLYPADRRLGRWASRVHQHYTDATAFRSPVQRERLRAQRQFERRLLADCRPYLADQTAPQRRLCLRIQRFLSELFVFVAHPEVPADNNAAERSLRPLVTARKISGGSRSAPGTGTRMALATLFGTWQVRRLDPLTACHDLLVSPHP